SLLPSPTLSRHQRQNAQRTARPLLDLQRRRDDDGALGGQEIQIRKALQPKPAFAVHVEMGGVGRIEVLPLTKISTYRLGATSMHTALFAQPLHDSGLRSRRVGAIVAKSGIPGIALLRPIRPQQDPTSRLDLAVARLPLLDKGNCQREIRIGCALLRTID